MFTLDSTTKLGHMQKAVDWRKDKPDTLIDQLDYCAPEMLICVGAKEPGGKLVREVPAMKVPERRTTKPSFRGPMGLFSSTPDPNVGTRESAHLIPGTPRPSQGHLPARKAHAIAPVMEAFDESSEDSSEASASPRAGLSDAWSPRAEATVDLLWGPGPVAEAGSEGAAQARSAFGFLGGLSRRILHGGRSSTPLEEGMVQYPPDSWDIKPYYDSKVSKGPDDRTALLAHPRVACSALLPLLVQLRPTARLSFAFTSECVEIKSITHASIHYFVCIYLNAG